LNFARFRRHLKGFRKTTTNTQVVGFTIKDLHNDVLLKASSGLDLKCDISELRLICSGGMVPDSPINGKPWNLGDYIDQNGGNQNRSKKVWGVCIPIGLEEAGAEAGPSTQDLGRISLNSSKPLRMKRLSPIISSSKPSSMYIFSYFVFSYCTFDFIERHMPSESPMIPSNEPSIVINSSTENDEESDEESIIVVSVKNLTGNYKAVV
jgi:hypothetical protein